MSRRRNLLITDGIAKTKDPGQWTVLVVRYSSEAESKEMTRPGFGRSSDVDLHQELRAAKLTSEELVEDTSTRQVASQVKELET